MKHNFKRMIKGRILKSLLLVIPVLFILCSCVVNNNHSDWPFQVTFVINGEKRPIQLERRQRLDLFDVPVVGNENVIGLYYDKDYEDEYDGGIIDASKTIYVKCNELNYEDYRMLPRIDFGAYIRIKILANIPGLYYACYGDGGPISTNDLYYIYIVKVLEVYTKDCAGNKVNDKLQIGAILNMGMIQGLTYYASHLNEFIVRSLYQPYYDAQTYEPLNFKGYNGQDPKLKGDILASNNFNTFPVYGNIVNFFNNPDEDEPSDYILHYYDFYPISRSMSTEKLSEWFDIVFKKQVDLEDKYNN